MADDVEQSLAVETGGGDQLVQGLARGLAVLRSFDADHQRMRLAEVAARSDTTRSAARRALLTFEALGYVSVESGIYELTPRVLEFGYSYLAGRSLAQLSRPFLQELTDRTGESSSITVLSGSDILYVERVHSRSIIRIDITVGARFPAVVTAMGRVMLASLSEPELDDFMRHVSWEPMTPATLSTEVEVRRQIAAARDQGWALVDQEFEIGLRSIAVPVLTSDDRVVAAINLSLRVRADEGIVASEVAGLVEQLTATASEIGRTLQTARRDL